MTVVKLMKKPFNQILSEDFSALPRELAQGMTEKRELKGADKKGEIRRDLNRTYFLGGKAAFLKFIGQCLNPVNDCETTYVQGQFDGSAIGKMSFIHLQNKNNWFSGLDSQTKQFAFYDDEGVACGLFLGELPGDPPLWTMVFIKNILSSPEEREVTMLFHPDLLEGQRYLVSSQQGIDTFLDALNSREVKGLLAPTFEHPPTKNYIVGSFLIFMFISISVGLVLGMTGLWVPFGVFLTTGLALYLSAAGVGALLVASLAVIGLMFREDSKTEVFSFDEVFENLNLEELKQKDSLIYGSSLSAKIFLPPSPPPPESPVQHSGTIFRNSPTTSSSGDAARDLLSERPAPF